MWGQKQLVNDTRYDLTITLNIRLSADPRYNAGKKTISMRPGESTRVIYGDERNPFLNGIEMIAILNGSIIATQELVITRGSDFDNKLNVNDTLAFLFANGAFVVRPSNTWTR
jgi:hypothetical protein